MVEASYNVVLAITQSYPGGNVAACSPSWVRQEAKWLLIRTETIVLACAYCFGPRWLLVLH